VGLFFCAPVAVLFLYSLGHSTIVANTFGHTLANYKEVFTDATTRTLVVRSVWIGALTGLGCVVVAYPLAYAITLGPLRRHGQAILFAVLLSTFAAYIVRIYAWRTLLGRDGVINRALEGIGLIHHPLGFLLYTRFAVVLTLINVWLPLAVLPLYASMSGIDAELVSAARTLGAKPSQAFRRVTLPLSSRGVRVAFALCCIGAAGDYVTPQLVGDPSSQLAGTAISADFGVNFNWAGGSALCFALVGAVALCVLAVFALLRLAGITERVVR
jgi:spermidine/putrescine transport system permease protein